MPEYILPMIDINKFSALPDIVQGYIEAMFFTEVGTEDIPALTFDDLSDISLMNIIEYCEKFEHDNLSDLILAIKHEGYTMTHAGQDLWFSSQDHGIGFMDRDLGEVGDRLHNACNSKHYVYYSDSDEKLYVEIYN